VRDTGFVESEMLIAFGDCEDMDEGGRQNPHFIFVIPKPKAEESALPPRCPDADSSAAFGVGMTRPTSSK
jgi:hypothetical protein